LTDSDTLQHFIAVDTRAVRRAGCCGFLNILMAANLGVVADASGGGAGKHAEYGVASDDSRRSGHFFSCSSEGQLHIDKMQVVEKKH
jgi:hypothetical protein